jgi:hypothetical protein
MDLDQQIAALIADAPQDGRTPELVRAIAPALKQVGKRLRHEQYYILQSPDQRWLSTTLRSQRQPQRQKTVIYAFADRQDALSQSNPLELQPAIAVSLPVIPLLFQLVTLTPIDSMIFFERPDHRETGTEIWRQEVEDLIQSHLQKIEAPLPPEIPPDLA